VAFYFRRSFIGSDVFSQHPKFGGRRWQQTVNVNAALH
jgi:hypothetical protein